MGVVQGGVQGGAGGAGGCKGVQAGGTGRQVQGGEGRGGTGWGGGGTQGMRFLSAVRCEQKVCVCCGCEGAAGNRRVRRVRRGGGGGWGGGGRRSLFYTDARSILMDLWHSKGVWGVQLPAMTGNNTIEYNHVHHVGNGDLSDLGGIYALGVQPGTKIRMNLVHHSVPYYMYGHGIYFDEGSSGILMEKNWVHSAFSALFMQVGTVE